MGRMRPLFLEDTSTDVLVRQVQRLFWTLCLRVQNSGSALRSTFFEQSQISVAMALLLRHALWLRIQPKRFELPTPFSRSIAQPLDVDAARQTGLNGSADQPGMVMFDMTDAASLAQSNLPSVKVTDREISSLSQRLPRAIALPLYEASRRRS
jgi:hypothetical protein